MSLYSRCASCRMACFFVADVPTFGFWIVSLLGGWCAYLWPACGSMWPVCLSLAGEPLYYLAGVSLVCWRASKVAGVSLVGR